MEGKTPASEDAHTTDKGTRYVILAFDSADDRWDEWGDRVAATSADSAIRKHVEAHDNTVGTTFVAVPERSWKPVKVETQRVVKLG